jgi:hypothetical protein
MNGAHMQSTEAIAGREDVSRFVIHLTRNDKEDFSDGASARANFLKIMTDQKIRALQPHCLFNKKLDGLAESVVKAFQVTCLTEVPLNQLHLLVRDIPGRRIKLEPYGFCFTKNFIIRAGGQPAIYINGYGGNTWLTECVKQLFASSISSVSADVNPSWRILPFINAMHERYDFTWEREWRVRGDVPFKFRDLVCVILPSQGADDIKDACAKSGLAAVSPGWTYEQIVSELAKQQSTTKFHWKKKKKR